VDESLVRAVQNLEAIAVGLFDYQVPQSGDSCGEYVQRLEYVAEFLRVSLLG